MQPPSNTGSFGAATGGMSPELQAAVQRRAGGNPSGPMAQVSNSAPTANPATQVPSPTPLTGSPSPTSTVMSATPQVGMAGSAGLPVESSEAQLILKALAGRLKMLPV